MSRPRGCSWVLALGALVLPVATVAAADAPRPVAVFSVASIDHVMGDLAYLTSLVGRSDVDGLIQMAVTPLMRDLDRAKPIGLLITIEGDEPKGVAFLPAPNLEKTLKVARDRFHAHVDDLRDGVKKLDLGKGVFLKQQGEWLFISDQPQHLANLPPDPVALLGGLDQQYSLAARFHVQNVPQNLRDLAAFYLHSQIDDGARSVALEDPEIDGAFLKSACQELKTAISMLFDQADQITIGWSVDSRSACMVADLQATAVDGSALAGQWSALAQSRTNFAGFLVDNAAVTFQAAARLSAQDGRKIQAVVEYLRSKALLAIQRDPNAPAALNEIVNGVLDVVDRTVQEGKPEVAASVVLAPKSFKFVAGLHVADGRALADAFQQLFELARQQPDVPDVRFFAARHGEIDLHMLTVPISERDTDWRRTLGDHLDVVVGTGPQGLYFGLGDQSDQLLKEAIDRSAALGEQAVPSVQLRIAAKPLLAFLASLEKADQKLTKMATILNRARGGDSILLTTTPLNNGFGCRLQIDEGVLEMFGKTAQPSED